MTPLLLTLPIAVEALYASDIDGDGVHELVAEGRDEAARSLAIVDLNAPERVRSLSLGDQAAWWDPTHGLWVVDGQGLKRADTGARVATLSTPLAHLGPALPARTRLVYDLDGDLGAELLLWSAGRLHGFAPDGRSLGSVPLPARGALEGGSSLGGSRLALQLESPAFSVADADGDGLRDVLVVQGQTLQVHLSGAGPTLGARSLSWTLPEALEDPLFQDREAYRFITDVHLRDLNGDGRVDLLLHKVLSDGSVFGTETELRVWYGTGAGFDGLQVLPIEGGSADVFPVDLDGDGDLELVCPRMDLDASGLARSLLDGRVQVALMAWVNEGGRYGTKPVKLKALRAPLSEGGASWNLFGDLDGDGAVDLAVHREGELSVWAGAGVGFADAPMFSVTTEQPIDELLVADLTGDGAAELVAWSRGSEQVGVWSLR